MFKSSSPFVAGLKGKGKKCLDLTEALATPAHPPQYAETH